MNKPAPLSQRQYEYFLRCFQSWFCVAEGGKRGGKNVLATLVFCSMLENHKNKIHLVAGVSVATAKLNILDCDGYGLLNYFEGRCTPGKYHDRDCVYVKTKTGLKIVLVSGGGKDGDEKLIKGNTYGMAYVTEANECHPKFLKEVFDRTASSSDRKIFHDLNPKQEEHWYYTDILHFHEEQQAQNPRYGYNYGHFTLVDNMSLSDAQITTVLNTYQKDSVWYKRDIRGERAVADGIIFRCFAENNAPYLYDEDTDPLLERDAKGKLLHRPSKVVIGIDFGGNGSMTTFVCTLYFNGYHDFRVAEEACLELSKDIDSDRICEKFIEFYRRCIDLYGRVSYVLPDSASTTLINSLRSAAQKARLPSRNIVGCRKNEISERPRMIDLLFNTGRLKVNRKCKRLRKAIGSLKWDEKKPNIPEDKNIGNCNDWWDGFCYCLLDFVEYIILDR